MEDFFEKMQEYLQMDEEIPFDEFDHFYRQYLDFLQQRYDQLSREELIKGKYIFSIVYMNSWDRSRRKNQYAKKYKKIAEKCQFWVGAIKHRLLKDGMTAEEIENAEKALSMPA